MRTVPVRPGPGAGRFVDRRFTFTVGNCTGMEQCTPAPLIARSASPALAGFRRDPPAGLGLAMRPQVIEFARQKQAFEFAKHP